MYAASSCWVRTGQRGIRISPTGADAERGPWEIPRADKNCLKIRSFENLGLDLHGVCPNESLDVRSFDRRVPVCKNHKLLLFNRLRIGEELARGMRYHAWAMPEFLKHINTHQE